MNNPFRQEAQFKSFAEIETEERIQAAINALEKIKDAEVDELLQHTQMFKKNNAKLLCVLIEGFKQLNNRGVLEEDTAHHHLQAMLISTNNLFEPNKNPYLNEVLELEYQHLRIEEELEVLSIHEIIGSLMRGHQYIGEEKRWTLWQQSYDFKFMGNTVGMFKILNHLFDNSLYQIRNNKKGNIFISTEERTDVNILRFKDTAGGASEVVLEHMFEDRYTTKVGSSGVGLFFCQNTMRKFGGDIDCNSVEGDFIEFILTFPKLK